jgi:hypothetical protein
MNNDVAPKSCPVCGSPWVERLGAFGQRVPIPETPRSTAPLTGTLKCARGHVWEAHRPRTI